MDIGWKEGKRAGASMMERKARGHAGKGTRGHGEMPKSVIRIG
jgi:hypothetical protein